MEREDAYDDDVTELSNEVVEQAEKDVAVVVKALLQMVEHFGLDLDEYRYEIGIGKLAGYLRGCANQGSPTQIVEAIGEFFDELRKRGYDRSRQRINGSFN